MKTIKNFLRTFFVIALVIILNTSQASAKISKSDVENAWDKISKADNFVKAPIEYEEDGAANAWVDFDDSDVQIKYSVHVTLALMEILNDEAEIAGILGHELGHIKLGHYNREVLNNIGQNLLEINKGSVNDLAQAVGNLDTDLNKSAFSREQEIEADNYGVKILVRAGYNSWALYKAMEHFKSGDNKSSAFDTHPKSAERLENLSAQAKIYEKKQGDKKIAVAHEKLSTEEISPVASDFTKWQRNQNGIHKSLKADEEDNELNGYRPSPMDLTHLTRNPPQNVKKRALSTNIPSKYDMRNTGLLTPVRDQNPYGTCWTHATMIACESNYLIRSKKGVINSKLGDAKKLNFSEMFLAWFAYYNPEKFRAFTTHDDRGNIKPASNLNTRAILDQGGNEFKAAALVSRNGVILESALPYAKAPNKNVKPENFNPVLRVKEITFAAPSTSSNEQMKIIKQLVMDKGAVLISYNEDSNYHDNKNHSYYKSGKQSLNHMVAIIGWDDNYPRSNFGRNKPNRNGAWLIRNSWGTTWGAGGYFWMSYEQNYNSGTSFTVEPVNQPVNVYCYDDLGWTVAINVNGKRTSYAANVFKAKGSNETLSEVGFYTTDNSSKYTVEIYKYSSKPSANNLTSSKPVFTKSGVMDLAGYHTLKVDGVKLKSGEYFAVAIKFSTPNYSYPVAVENYFKGYTDTFAINAGESYFSGDGKNWFDGINYKSGNKKMPVNACIKAFTVSGASTPEKDEPKNEDEENDYDYDYDDDNDDEDEIITPSGNAKTIVAKHLPVIKRGASWSLNSDGGKKRERPVEKLVNKIIPQIVQASEWVNVDDENYDDSDDETDYDDKDEEDDDEYYDDEDEDY